MNMKLALVSGNKIYHVGEKLKIKLLNAEETYNCEITGIFTSVHDTSQICINLSILPHYQSIYPSQIEFIESEVDNDNWEFDEQRFVYGGEIDE